jgi:magnesium transporter
MANAQETTRILRRLLASGMTGRAERLLARMRPADRGPVVSSLTPPEIRTVVDLLFQQHRAASTLKELPSEMLPQVFEALGDERLAQILSRLELDDMVELFEWLEEERREPVLALLPEERRLELRKAELYPPSSAGRVMVTRFIALEEGMTAQEAIDRIRKEGRDTEAILYLYVVDAERRLRGVVPIRRLVAASPETPCVEIMVRDPVYVRADADQEEVAQLVHRYNLLAIPVVDDAERIVGVITVDDVIEVIHEEATEDIYRLAGLSEEDRVFSPARKAVGKRLPWMLLNLGAAFVVASVIGLFEHTLQELVALAFFMPVVAGMGGNSGIQALTVVTRAIALGEIEFSTGLRAIAKEMSVSLVIGLITGLVSGALAYFWMGSAVLGAALFASMVITLALAGLLGAAVPLVLKALGADPAVGSGVFVTTLTDVCAFSTFLGIGALALDRLA